MRLLAFLISLCLTGSASAALAQTAPSAGSEQIVIHAGTLLDRPGRAPRRNATIVVSNGRIVSVADGFTPPPAGARLIDLSDRFVLPGLIDSHVHLTSDRAGV